MKNNKGAYCISSYTQFYYKTVAITRSLFDQGVKECHAKFHIDSLDAAVT